MAHLRCIHGMIWKTCGSCREKSEEAVLAELRFRNEEQKKELIYDYQEASVGTGLDADTDLAYDIDDMGM